MIFEFIVLLSNFYITDVKKSMNLRITDPLPPLTGVALNKTKRMISFKITPNLVMIELENLQS